MILMGAKLDARRRNVFLLSYLYSILQIHKSSGCNISFRLSYIKGLKVVCMRKFSGKTRRYCAWLICRKAPFPYLRICRGRWDGMRSPMASSRRMPWYGDNWRSSGKSMSTGRSFPGWPAVSGQSGTRPADKIKASVSCRKRSLLFLLCG